jgi:hypothetical protein
MIWSPLRKFCFIHIAKTGGTSFEHAYIPHIKFGDVVLAAFPYGIDLWYWDAMSIGKHSSAHRINQVVGKTFFADMLSVAVVRHPVDRMLSYFRWIHSYDHVGDFEKQLKMINDFSVFVDAASPKLSSQSRMVRDYRTGELLVKYLIPFPYIKAGWGAVASYLNIDSPLPHTNSSKKEIKVEVTREAVEKLEANFKGDFDLYEASMTNFVSEIQK